MKSERNKPFDSPDAVISAAKLAGIEIRGMDMEEINEAVLKTGQRIISMSEKNLPKNYRRIQTPENISPLSLSIATILARSV